MMTVLEVFVPLLPPGINQTYKIGNGRMYKSQQALGWENDACLIIGAKAGEIEWEKTSEYYQIEIKFNNWRMDSDGPIKLVIDTLTRKLGFDDKYIKRQCSERIELGEKGVWIKLEPYFPT